MDRSCVVLLILLSTRDETNIEKSIKSLRGLLFFLHMWHQTVLYCIQRLVTKDMFKFSRQDHEMVNINIVWQLFKPYGLFSTQVLKQTSLVCHAIQSFENVDVAVLLNAMIHGMKTKTIGNSLENTFKNGTAKSDFQQMVVQKTTLFC